MSIRDKLLALLYILCLLSTGCVNSEREGATSRTEKAPQETQSDQQLTDERQRRLILGKWTDNYKGRRVLTVRPDGTATMIVEPAGLSGRLFASELTFDERWRIEDGRLVMKAVGGEPKGRVKLILKTMGDESDQEILELTEDRMLLLDSDGKTRYDWRRPSDDENHEDSGG